MISCVPAKEYGERFLNFMRDEVIIDDKYSEAEHNRNSVRSSLRESTVVIHKTPSLLLMNEKEDKKKK